MTYHIPALYAVSHVALGALSFWWPLIIAVFMLYQILQYILGVRFFLLNSECAGNGECIASGNSWPHTMNKIVQFALGWCIAAIFLAVLRPSRVSKTTQNCATPLQSSCAAESLPCRCVSHRELGLSVTVQNEKCGIVSYCPYMRLWRVNERNPEV